MLVIYDKNSYEFTVWVYGLRVFAETSGRAV